MAAVFVPEHCVLVVQDVEHVCVSVEEIVTVEQMTVQDVTGDSEQELVDELVEEDVSEEDDDPEDSDVAEEVTDPILETAVDACEVADVDDDCEELVALLESDGV